jgi:uncharacterized protein YjbI with pentapeptide repeats
MANDEHITLLKQGVATWNAWRDANPSIRPDLSEADLRWANLSRAYLSRADLSGADLIEANLTEAELSWISWSEQRLKSARGRRAAVRALVVIDVP